MKHWRITIALLVAGCLVTLAGVALAQQAGWIAPLVEEYSRVWKGAYDETAKYDLPQAGREAVADRVLDAHIATRSAPYSGGPSLTPQPGTGDCGQTITSDGTVSGQWAAGCDSAVSGRGHARYYSFTLTSDSDVTITLESSDTDTYLYLRQGHDRSGAFLHENDDHNGSIAISEIQEHLDAGTYTIEATTYSTGSTGSFTLTLSRAASGPAGEPRPRPDRLTVADIDGYTSNFRVEIFVSSIGVNLTMSRRNVFTADGFTVRLDSDENLTARGVGLSVADRYYWSCNPVNGSTGESRHYASDDYDAAAGLPKTDLDNAPLRDSSLGRRVIRMCNGEESTPSRTVTSEWSERSPLP